MSLLEKILAFIFHFTLLLVFLTALSLRLDWPDDASLGPLATHRQELRTAITRELTAASPVSTGAAVPQTSTPSSEKTSAETSALP